MTFMPRQKTARIAPYLLAIQEAHESGWTWSELMEVLNNAGLDIADKPVNLRHTFQRAIRRYEKSTVKPRQQPLPGLENTRNNEPEFEQAQKQNQSESVGDRQEDSTQSDAQSESQPEPDKDNEGETMEERFKRLKAQQSQK